MGWIRLHEDLIYSPKVSGLPAAEFGYLVKLWLLANKHGGVLPNDLDTIGWWLRIGDRSVVDRLLDRFVDRRLIDKLKGGANGAHYAIHDWDVWQYKSDSSTDRVRRFRERSKHVASNGEKPLPKRPQNRTEETTEPEETQNPLSQQVVKEGEEGARENAPAPAAAEFSYLGEAIKITPAKLAKWRAEYPLVDVLHELPVVDAHLVDHPPDDGKFLTFTARWLKRANAEAATKQETIPMTATPLPAGQAAKVYVSTADPRWPALEDRYRREKGKGPPTSLAKASEPGWYFPPDWLDALVPKRQRG